MAKTVAIGSKNFKTGSKRANEAVAAGGTISSKSADVRRNADASIARTSSRSTSDPLTVAENVGQAVPGRIASGQTPVIAPTSPVGASDAPPPVTTPAAAPTPTQEVVGYEDAQKNLSAGGLSGDTLKMAQASLANRYQQGFAAANASGLPAPADPGAARGAVASYLPASPPDSGVVDDIFAADPQINSLMQNVGELLKAQNQVPSIMQDYKNLRKSSGLDDINEELIDAETILSGTESDVRREIEIAGGFGTESQVQAMVLSRNKNLLKRYNQLVQMKTDATNQLNTMLQLTQQDRQMAQERMSTAISTMFNMANFRQNALQNTRSQYQWLATQDPIGFYNSMSKNPQQVAMAEKILGTGPGGLQGFANQAIEKKRIEAEERAFDRSVQEQQLAISRSNAAATWANVGLAREKFEYDKTAGKPQTAAQLQVQGFADRTSQSDKTISQFGAVVAKNPVSRFLPNFLKPGQTQQVEQAQRNFVNSVLRRESGAAISDSEFENANKQYFPKYGDGADVIAQKAANRQTVINNLYDQAGAVRSAEAGQMVQGADGQTYQVSSDGSSLIPL